MKTRRPYKKLTFNINEDSHAVIKTEAAKRRMSITFMLLTAIREYINKPVKSQND